MVAQIRNIDELLVYSLWRLEQEGEETTFEKLVVRSFQLFPEHFGLQGFESQYPDASRINKTWLRCRSDRNWIAGSTAHGFRLTPSGLGIAEKVDEEISSSSKKNIQVSAGYKRSKGGRIVLHIEKHLAFKKYINTKKVDDITDFEISDLLFCTLDSFPETRRKNLQEISEYVRELKRTDIELFLKKIREDRPALFGDINKQKKGGMMSKLRS